MSNIFISYKREEQVRARELADALERNGWSVWWDPKILPGERFDDVIEQALHEAECVIVLWSNLSIESKYVKDEASYALRRHKLVPVFLEDVVLPFRYENIHTHSLVGWDGKASSPFLRELISAISDVLRVAQDKDEDIDNPPILNTEKIIQNKIKIDSGKNSYKMLFVAGIVILVSMIVFYEFARNHQSEPLITSGVVINKAIDAALREGTAANSMYMKLRSDGALPYQALLFAYAKDKDITDAIKSLGNDQVSEQIMKRSNLNDN